MTISLNPRERLGCKDSDRKRSGVIKIHHLYCIECAVYIECTVYCIYSQSIKPKQISRLHFQTSLSTSAKIHEFLKRRYGKPFYYTLLLLHVWKAL